MVNQKPTPTPTGPSWQQRLQHFGDKALRVLFGSRVLVIDGAPRNIGERNREIELLCTEGLRSE